MKKIVTVVPNTELMSKLQAFRYKVFCNQEGVIAPHHSERLSDMFDDNSSTIQLEDLEKGENRHYNFALLDYGINNSNSKGKIIGGVRLSIGRAKSGKFPIDKHICKERLLMAEAGEDPIIVTVGMLALDNDDARSKGYLGAMISYIITIVKLAGAEYLLATVSEKLAGTLTDKMHMKNRGKIRLEEFNDNTFLLKGRIADFPKRLDERILRGWEKESIQCPRVIIGRDEALCCKGGRGEKLWLIIYGKLNVILGSHVAPNFTGELTGEMSPLSRLLHEKGLLDKPIGRSADVVSGTLQSTLIEVDYNLYREMHIPLPEWKLSEEKCRLDRSLRMNSAIKKSRLTHKILAMFTDYLARIGYGLEHHEGELNLISLAAVLGEDPETIAPFWQQLYNAGIMERKNNGGFMVADTGRLESYSFTIKVE